MRQKVMVLLLVLLTARVPAYAQSFDDRTIRPGEGIGPVRLGMSLDQVTDAMGRKPDGESAQDGLPVHRWNLEGGAHTGLTPTPVLLAALQGGAVQWISTTSGAFATPGGAGVGFSLNAFKQELVVPYRGTKEGTARHLRFDTAGLAVTYDVRGAGLTTVTAVTVFRAAAAMPEPGPAILPGVGIGPVRLGMSADQAIRAVGRAPARRARTSNGAEFLVFVLPERDAFGESAWLGVTVANPGGVMLITTDASGHQTAQGSAPGIGILELQAEFGAHFSSEPLVLPGAVALMGIWYRQHGIAGFYLPPDGQKRILMIGVFRNN